MLLGAPLIKLGLVHLFSPGSKCNGGTEDRAARKVMARQRPHFTVLTQP